MTSNIYVVYQVNYRISHKRYFKKNEEIVWVGQMNTSEMLIFLKVIDRKFIWFIYYIFTYLYIVIYIICKIQNFPLEGNLTKSR